MASSKKTTIANSTRANTKWLGNAAKSIGITVGETFSKMTPNISSTVKQATTSASMVKSMIAGKGSLNRIHTTLASNKYIQYGKTAYKNALRDLKTGNFNNKAAEEEYFNKSLGFDDNDDIGFDDSFGDFDIDDGGSSSTPKVSMVTVTNDGSAQVHDAINQQTRATLETGKASIDAQVALTSTALQQMRIMSDESNKHLSSIESHLATMIEFNNQNVLKYLESSTAYMEKMGGQLSDDYQYNSSQGSSASDIFGSDGSINMNAYKASIKKGIVNALGPIGSLGSMISDDMIESIIANPLGTLSSFAVGSIIPASLEAGVKGIEKAFSSFVPGILDKISSWKDDTSASLLKRSVGKVFGVKNNREDLTETEGITADPVSFDGVTRATITRIIPKELREQTAYLKLIAEHYKLDTKSAVDNADVFDMSRGQWSNVKDMTKRVAESLESAVTDSFRSSDFGKSLADVEYKIENKEEQESFKKLLNDFFINMERENKFINFKDKDDKVLKSIFESMEGSHSKRDISLLLKRLDDMVKNDPAATMNASNARIQATGAWNQSVEDLRKSDTVNGLMEGGGFLKRDKNGDPIPLDYTLAKLGNRSGGYIKKVDAEVAKKHAENNPNDNRNILARHEANRRRNKEYNDDDYDALLGREKKTDDDEKDKGLFGAFNEKYSSFKDKAKSKYAEAGGAFNSLVTGTSNSIQSFFADILYGKDTNVAEGVSNIVRTTATNAFNVLKDNFFTPFKNALFGVKGEDGYSEGGIFSGAKNKFKDIFNNVKYAVTGHEYTDSDGVKHQKKDDSIFGSFRKIAIDVKESFMDKFFGTKTGEDGEREKNGLFSYVTGAFKDGLQGWKDSIFGTEDPEAEKKKMMEQIQEKAPGAVTGAAIGGGLGLMGIGFLNPMLGASLGLVGGILSKSETFQKYLFGEKDDDGNRLGGLITKRVQDYVKERKNPLIAGAVTGGITGGLGIGILGNLAGGPVVGALLGTASSLAVKSETFQKFLYGKDMDKKSGEGFVGAVKNIFKGSQKSTKDTQSNAKMLGMGTIAAGGGAIAGTIISHGLFGAMLGPVGPIGGALIGLAATVKASGGQFKEWLFGKDVVDEKGNTIHKKGVIGQFGGMLHTAVINPLKHKLENVTDIMKADFKYAIGTIGNIFLPVVKGIADKGTEVKDTVVGGLKKIGKSISDIFVNPIVDLVHDHIIKPVKTIISGVTNILFKGARAVVMAPFKLVGSLVKVISSPFVKAGNNLRKALGKGIKKIVGKTLGAIGGIFKIGMKVVTSPLKLAAKGISAISGLKDARDANKGKKEGPIDKIKDIWSSDISTGRRQKLLGKQRKTDLFNARNRNKENKVHDKNALAIAKATNWQYTEDSAEARKIAIAAGAKINTRVRASDELTEEEKDDKKKKRASIISGDTNTEDLDSAEEQQVSLLGKILNVITGHTPDGKKMRNGFFDSDGDEGGSRFGASSDLGSGIDPKFKEKYDEYRKQGMSASEAKKAAQEDIENSNPYEEGSVQYYAHQGAEKIQDSAGRLMSSFFGAMGVEGAEDNSFSGNISKLFGHANDDESSGGIGGFVKGLIGINDDPEKASPFGKALSTLFDFKGNGYAKGTDNADDETALVGEKGPELRALNKGDSIIPTNKPIAVYITGAKDGVLESNEPVDVDTSIIDATEARLKAYNPEEFYNRLFSSSQPVVSRESLMNSEDGSNTESASMYTPDTETEEEGGQDTGDITNIAKNLGAAGSSIVSGLIGNNGTEEQIEKKEDIAAAIATDQEHKERADKVFSNAKTAEELQKEKEKEREESERIQREKDNHANIATQVTETKKHGFNWMSIFSKKGLITGAAIAGFLWLKNKLPGIADAIINLGANLGKTLGEAVLTIIENLGFGGNNNDDNKSQGEKLQENVEDLTSGDPARMLLGENYEGNHQTYARTKLVTKFSGKAADGGVKLGRLIMHPKESLKTLGKNIKQTKSIKKGFKNTWKQTNGLKDDIAAKIADSPKKLSEKFQNIAGKYEDKMSQRFINKNTVKGTGENTAATIDRMTGVNNTPIDKATHNAKQSMYDDVFGGAANAGDDVAKGASGLADDAAKIATNTGDDIVKGAAGLTDDVVKGAANLGDDVAKGATKLVKSGASAVDDVAEIAAKSKGGIIKTCKDAVGKFLEKLATGSGEKAKAKVGKDVFKKLAGQIDEVIERNIAKITKKIGAILSSEAASAAAVGIGWLVKNGLSVTVGAVDGLTGTARLFRVNKDNVDALMTIISTVIGGFKGLAIGAIIDVVNELVSSVLGVDFISEAACVVYKFLMRVVGKDEKALKLDEYRDNFKDEYSDHKKDTLLKQKETMAKAGLIKADMTDEEFLAAADNGDIKVSVDGFSEYNDKQNAGVISKATTATMSGLGKGAVAVKNFFVGEKKKSYTDANGNVYTDAGDGMYRITDSSGNDLGTVSKEAVDTSGMEETVTKKGANIFGKVGSTVANGFMYGLDKTKEGLSSAGATISSGFNFAKDKLGEGFNYAKEGLGKFGANVSEGFNNGLGMAKEGMNKAGEWVKGAASLTLKAGQTLLTKDFWLAKSGKGYQDPTDMSYYIWDGATYKHYSIDNEFIEDITEPERIEDINSKIRLFVYKPYEYHIDAGRTKVWNDLKTNLGTAWTTLKDTTIEKWNNGLDWAKEKAKSMKTSLIDFKDKSIENLGNTVENAKTSLITFKDDSIDWAKETAKNMKDSLINFKDQTIENLGNAVEGAKTALVTFKDDSINWVKTKASDIKTGLGAFKDKTIETWNNSVDWVKTKASSVKSKFTDLFIGKSATAYVDSNDFSYYITNDDGQTYEHYSGSGDKLGDITDADQVEQIKQCISSGMYTEGQVEQKPEIYKNIADIRAKGKEIATNAITNTKEFLKDMGDKALKAFDKNGKVVLGMISGKRGTGQRGFFLNDEPNFYYQPSSGNWADGDKTTYDKYNLFGEKVQEGITYEDFVALEPYGHYDENVKNYRFNAGAKIREMASSAKEVFNTGVDKAKEIYGKAKDKVISIWSKISDTKLVGLVGVFKRNKTGKFGWHDPEGNYYYRDGDTGPWTYYNIHGDVLEENVSDDIVSDKASGGLLTWKEITEDSSAQSALKKIGESVKGAWDKAKNVVSGGWEKFTNWISGGSGGSGIGISPDQTGGFGDYHFPNGNFGGSGKGNNVRMGGSGNDPKSLNGYPYRSQLDPSIADKPYTIPGASNDDATYGTTGCYPTAMGPVVEKLTGEKVSTEELGRFAQATGSRDNTGTNWSYLTNAANAYGLDANPQIKPSSSFILNNASPDHPMILSGVDDGSMGTDSPFTSAGHAVTVVGSTSDGKVIINNPLGTQKSGKYDIADIARQTDYGVLYSKGGSGRRGGRGLLKRLRGGLGRLFGGGRGGGRGGDPTKWVTTVKAVKKAIADLQKGYAQDGFDPITIGGVTHKVRRDCSGFVCACLQYYGYDLKDHCLWTGNMMDSSSPLAKTDFKMSKWSGWDSLKEGDIIVNKTHTEIFCRNEGGNHYVYNCGGNKSVNNPNATITGHSSYNVVWSLGEGPSGSTDITSTGDTGTSSTSTSGNSGTQNILSNITSFFSEVGTRAVNGVISGTFDGDYNDYINGTQNTSASTTTSGTTGPGSDYPKYQLTPAQKDVVATVITGETGGTDKVAAYQEASQIVNLNEVTKGKEPTGENLEKTLRSGWYAKASFGRGKTDTAMQAVEDVVIGGKRTLPRYVVEHDTFPMDILSAKSRDQYKQGDPVSNKYGSNYKFYSFFGSDGKGDIAGYFPDKYDKYKDDKPFTVGGSGRGASSGLDMSGGIPSYQQNSSDLSNVPYDNGDGATLGDTGCGPSALATLNSYMTNQPTSVAGIAGDAQRYGMRDETGTNANFIGMEASRLGIDTLREDGPSKGSLINSLKQGRPVMTLGQSRDNSLYTDSGHYLNALGLDRGGNVLYADSMKPGLHKSPISKFARNTDVAWHVGGAREGGRGLSLFMNKGGRGRTFYEPEYIHDFPFYQQHDERWGSEAYGKYSGATTIAAAGCGPSAAAMVACSYGDKYDPPMVCDWMVDNGHRSSNNGTDQSGIIAFFKSIGYDTGALSGFDQCLEKLQQGIPIVACMGPGHFTGAGHYIVLSGIDQNGDILVSDSSRNGSLEIPDGRDRSKKAWSQSIIGGELMHSTYASKNGKGSIGNIGKLSGSSSTSATPTGKSGSDTFMSQLSSLSSEIATRAMNGMVTGDFDGDYTDFLNGTQTADSMTSTSGGTSTTAPADLSQLNKDSFRNSDIKTLPKLSENQIKTILDKRWVSKGNSVYTAENAAAVAKGIAEAQDTTGISSLIPLGIGAWESGWGTSKIAREKGNLWGWAAYNATPGSSATTFGNNSKTAFEGYTDNLVKTYYDGYGAHSIHSIGTGDNPSGKGYAYTDDGAISKEWASNVSSVAMMMVDSAKGGSGRGRKMDASIRNRQNRYPVTRSGGRGFIGASVAGRSYSNNELNDVRQVLSDSQVILESRSKGSTNSSIEEFYYQVIQMLGVIANNTGMTANNVKEFQGNQLTIEGGSNTVQPIVVGSQGPSGDMQNLINKNNDKVSRNQKLASQIARGE